MEIHQFVESFSDADAIGYHALGIQELLRTEGIKSNIYANNFDQLMEKKCHHFTKFNDQKHEIDTKLIYHHSIYSEAYKYLKQLNYEKHLIFHNISPPEFFNHQPDFRRLLGNGYDQLKEFNNVFKTASADSEYNVKVLNKYNFNKKTRVIPPFVNLETKFRPYITKPKKDKKTKIIFVSKISPHKRQTDLIKVFQTYRKIYNKDSQLYIIGGFNPDDNFYQKLNKLSQKTAEVFITGKISLKKLVYHYQTADLFLCLSEHEGFGIPIIEAMFFGLPIIAYNAAAVPDTLGKGGILINTKSPLYIASTIDYLLNDKSLKQKLLENQKNELEKYEPEKIKGKLRKWLIKN